MDGVVSLVRELVVVRSTVAWHGHVSHDPFARLQLSEGRRDPYSIYAEVRQRGELIPTPLVGFQTASHRLCREVLRDRRFGVQTEDWPKPATSAAPGQAQGDGPGQDLQQQLERLREDYQRVASTLNRIRTVLDSVPTTPAGG